MGVCVCVLFAWLGLAILLFVCVFRTSGYRLVAVFAGPRLLASCFLLLFVLIIPFIRARLDFFFVLFIVLLIVHLSLICVFLMVLFIVHLLRLWTLICKIPFNLFIHQKVPKARLIRPLPRAFPRHPFTSCIAGVMLYHVCFIVPPL